MQNELILVGSNSVHTQRYLKAVSGFFKQVIFITNHVDDTVLPLNVKSHNVNFKLSNLKARFQIARIIQHYPTAVVHIHQANSYAYHTLKAIKSAKLTNKTILTTWGSDILVLPATSRLLKCMVRFNLTNSDIITSDSLYMSAQIKQLCPTVKELHTINFGMQHFPHVIDLSQKENIILSNRLHKNLYNVDKIIASYAQLISQDSIYRSFKLVIAASGSETENLKAQAQNLGIDATHIEFTGMLSYEDLVNLYKKAKIFVSIPDSDASSLSVQEAMGYGCYPILSNLPANLEWVIDTINGSINQNPAKLDLDLELAIKFTSDNTKYTQLAEFNHHLIQQKSVFEDNLPKFLTLYE